MNPFYGLMNEEKEKIYTSSGLKVFDELYAKFIEDELLLSDAANSDSYSALAISKSESYVDVDVGIGVNTLKICLFHFYLYSRIVKNRVELTKKCSHVPERPI